ncbi:Cytochrome P450 4A25 [Rhizoctonia solani]|uniref:Cytochrome P450 4A25 n=1 Tax=Rhizoctonia solani TaxID=456999 RepID=A0A0K6G6J6_9AGAM|nr:Cytochrome P450 4A25 [Rhizoctonia solani]
MKRRFMGSGDGLKLQGQWMETYGSTYSYRGFLLSYRLFTADTRALTYIMTQTDTFPKPDSVRKGLAEVVGYGLISAEGDVHKRQRRIMSPSFGPAQIRELVPIFWNRANKLRDIWLDILKESPDGTINVLSWLSRATLDIIGAAGFDHHFNSLEGNDKDELSAAFKKIFQSSQSPGLLALLTMIFPILRYIPTQRKREVAASLASMRRIGTKLIADKKAALERDDKMGSNSQGRDLLTLLIKSNIQSENAAHRMSDEEVLSQISTFLVAGHETTSTSTTWALYALAKHPRVQRKLREELLECGLGDEPGMTELDKLPYLDHFIRECLRVHSPVPNVPREATHDVQIPVSKSYKDKYGVEHNYISLQKGDMIIVPIMTLHEMKEIWGEDAAEFRPERWERLPEAANEMPGVLGHLMTFIHGQRSCIGYRFSIIEMKALIYSLVRSIEFSIDPKILIGITVGAVIRPHIASEREKGNQMPLICKPVSVI